MGVDCNGRVMVVMKGKNYSFLIMFEGVVWVFGIVFFFNICIGLIFSVFWVRVGVVFSYMFRGDFKVDECGKNIRLLGLILI